MLLKDTIVNIGGLYRCCLQHLADVVAESTITKEATDGDTIECPHCGETMILVGNAWQWKQ